jgi:hypothetical protein
MQLDIARLCLDCDEIHDSQICPACGSEAFAFLTRWVKPTGDEHKERRQPPPVSLAAATHPVRTPEQIEAFRQLIEGKPPRPTGRGLVAKGFVGLAAVSLLGWAWRASGKKPPATDRSPSTVHRAPSSVGDRSPTTVDR